MGRNIKDNKRSSLRYCTISQNSFNKCKGKSNLNEYHGVTTECYISNNPVTDNERNALNRLMVWFNIIAMNPLMRNEDYKRKYKKTYLSTTCCKAHLFKSDFKDYTNYLNDVIHEIYSNVLYDETLVYEFTKEGQKNVISKDKIKVMPNNTLLRSMFNSYQDSKITVNKFIRPKQLCVIVSDLIKIYMHRSFAHTNVIPSPVQVTPIENEGIMYTPEQIMNIYEYYSDNMKSMQSLLGVEEPTKFKLKYAKAGRVLKAQLVDASKVKQQVQVERKKIDVRLDILDKAFVSYYEPLRVREDK